MTFCQRGNPQVVENTMALERLELPTHGLGNCGSFDFVDDKAKTGQNAQDCAEMHDSAPSRTWISIQLWSYFGLKETEVAEMVVANWMIAEKDLRKVANRKPGRPRNRRS